jgi:rhamnosyltransferase
MEEMNNNIKMLGLVTLYHPDFPNAVDNIMRYLPYLDSLVIWDNSPLEHNLKQNILALLDTEADKVIWYGDGNNYCVAPAINYSWHYAQENHYDSILLMDQDSQWESFRDFRKQVEECLIQNDNRVFCPYIIGNDFFEITQEIQNKRVFITSGTVIPIKILNKVGGADEAFPLDALDNDLAIRIQKAGYSIVCLTKHILHHTIGEARRMGPLRLFTSNYGPERTYSVTRSHILLLRKHHSWLTLGEIYKILREHFLYKVIRIVFAEPQKIKKFKSFFKGVNDGFSFNLSNTII